jgi:hypothetical protein
MPICCERRARLRVRDHQGRAVGGRSVRSRSALAMNKHTALEYSERALSGPPVVPQILLVVLRLTGGDTLAARGRLPVAWRAVILLDDVSRQSAMCGHLEALPFGPCTDMAATVAALC